MQSKLKALKLAVIALLALPVVLPPVIGKGRTRV